MDSEAYELRIILLFIQNSHRSILLCTKLQDEIQTSKRLLSDDKLRNFGDEYCSKTEIEGEGEGIEMSDALGTCEPINVNGTTSRRLTSATSVEESDDDVPLISFIHPRKNLPKLTMPELDSHGKRCISYKTLEGYSRGARKLSNIQQQPHKHARLVISDDEIDEHDEVIHLRGRLHVNTMEDVATSNGDKRRDESVGLGNAVFGSINLSLFGYSSDKNEQSVRTDSIDTVTTSELVKVSIL